MIYVETQWEQRLDACEFYYSFNRNVKRRKLNYLNDLILFFIFAGNCCCGFLRVNLLVLGLVLIFVSF